MKIMTFSILVFTLFTFSPHLVTWGSMYYDIRLHATRSYTSSLDSPFSLRYALSVQPFPLQHSSPPPTPLDLYYYRPPSYLILTSSHHIATFFPGLSSRFPPLSLLIDTFASYPVKLYDSFIHDFMKGKITKTRRF